LVVGSEAETQAREAVTGGDAKGSKEAGWWRRRYRKAEGKPRGRVDVPSSRVCSWPQTSGRLVPLARYLGIHRFSCDQDRAAPVVARVVPRKGTDE